MNNYQFTLENLKELNLATKNANNLEELIQQTREEIRNEEYLADEIKEVFNLYKHTTTGGTTTTIQQL